MNNQRVTVVIPVGPSHLEVANRAVASVQAQTVPTRWIALRDPDGRGPAYVRNRALEQVSTDYVVFLDADDWLEPAFVEECLKAARPGRYVYTDWLQDSRLIMAPVKPWCGGSWHVITSLLPSEAVKMLGGFDETLPGAEDTEFYLKLTTNGICGTHVQLPLMHYGADGVRGKAFVHGPRYDEVMQGLARRYNGKMGCCGDTVEMKPVQGDHLPTDVLAVALWGGNRREIGRATGRIYPRSGNGALMYIDPQDIALAPNLWQVIDQPKLAETELPAFIPTFTTAVNEPPVLNGVAEVAWTLMGAAQPQVTAVESPSPNTDAVNRTDVRPDVETVLRLAGRK